MLETNEIAAKVNRLAEIKRQTAALKSESDGIEAELLKQFETDVEDTKYRTVRYSGDGAAVIANYADKVALVYPSMLKKIFGAAYKDVVTETVDYKLSANAKRLLAALYKKEYLRGTSVESCIGQITADEKTRRVLALQLVNGIVRKLCLSLCIHIAYLNKFGFDKIIYAVRKFVFIYVQC